MCEALAVLALSCGRPVRVPKYACWIAQGKNGEWWGYITEPAAGGHEWRVAIPDTCSMFAIGTKPKDFRTMIWKL